MYYTKRLILLAICVISLGLATESQYLEYAIESLDTQELLDRQLEKDDRGFQIETQIKEFHPVLDNGNINPNASSYFLRKCHRSYTRKRAYY